MAKKPPVKGSSRTGGSQTVYRQNSSRRELAVSAASKANANMLALIRPQARDRWSAATLQNYTPDRITQVLRGVVGGSFTSQWELFDLMEDTWPRLKGNLNELKRAVMKVDMLPVAFGEDKKATPLALKKKEVLTAAMSATLPDVALDENSWEDNVYDICDAVGKCISVQEILWDVRNGMVLPRAFQWIYPRHYGYWTDQPQLQISKSGMGGDWSDFPPDKFVIATFKTKTGHLLTSAMLRSLATLWIGANFSYDWALNLAQMFGLPIRWATYDPTNPKLLDEICDMLENMGSAGWGAFPAGTTLELKEAVKDAAHNPQSFLIQLADITADILIKGQTLTTAQGSRGSQALGKVHADIRFEVIEFVASWVAKVLNYQFVPALMRLNFGNNDEDPYLIADIEQQKDALQMAQRDLILFGEMGVPVKKMWFYQRHDVPVPEEGDDILVVQIQPAPAGPGGGSNGSGTQARLIDAKASGTTATDQLINNVIENLTGVQARWLGDVRPFFVQLFEYAKSNEVTDAELIRTIEESAKVIPELFGKLKTQELEDALYNAMSAATVNGVARGFMLRNRRRIKEEAA
jgi:phage gp29-like protein